MKRQTGLHLFRHGSVWLLAAALLIACGGNQGTATAPTERSAVAAPTVAASPAAPTETVAASPAATAKPAATAPAASSEKTQLLLWDTDSDNAAKMDELIGRCSAVNPNITIKREVQTTEQIRNVLRTALDAGQGPDIFAYDTGPGFAGVLAQAGLLLPLDAAYEQYGWNQRLFPLAKERTTFGGKTYGIGNQLEVVGVFYNKRIFAELGLSEPKTHEELIATAKKIKDAGLIPIAFADQDKWPAGHTFSVFAGNIAGREKLAQAISGEIPWNSPEFVQAIEIPFTQMRQAGYFIPELNAVSYDDWQSLFYAGKAAMSLTGTWQVSNYSNPKNMTDPVGFFLYPAINGGPVAAPSGLGSGYFVSSKTAHPDAALRTLDCLFSKENARFWVEQLNQIPPIAIDPSSYKVTDLMRLTLGVLQAGPEKLGYNIDVLTPDNFNTVMFDGFQEVLSGTKTAQQQADDLQKAIEQAKVDKKIFDITK